MKRMMVGLLFLTVAANAFAYYMPGQGRWLSRDPVDEPGFGILSSITTTAALEPAGEEVGIQQIRSENPYVFVGNDAIQFFDYLGLLWKVDRNGAAKAPAVPEAGDTIADLAALIGLNASDYRQWLTPVAGSIMPSSASQPLTACDKFEIPNTVVAYWAGDLGFVGRWWVRWNSSNRYLEARGFNVDDQRHQRGSYLALQNLLTPTASSKELHGLYFWGHGSAPYPARYLMSSSRDIVLDFQSLNLSYKMGLGLVFACDSNSGQSALMSGSSGNIWRGFSGTLVPWPFRHYHAKHYIHPSQQLTK